MQPEIEGSFWSRLHFEGRSTDSGARSQNNESFSFEIIYEKI